MVALMQCLGRCFTEAGVPVFKTLASFKAASAFHPFEVDFIFNCYLTAPRPTLGHYRGDSLIHPILIPAFLQFRPEGHRNLVPGVRRKLVARGKMSPRSGSAALIQLNPIHEKGTKKNNNKIFKFQKSRTSLYDAN